MSPKQRLYVRLLLVAAVVVVVDQFTKGLALRNLKDGPIDLFGGLLTFQLTFNSGGAFGFFQGIPGFFLIVSLAVVVLILIWVGRSDETGYAVPLGLVLGGGIGNVCDRIFRDFGGRVVDFIDVHFWPVFNIADAAIVIGVALIVIASFRPKEKPSPE